MVCPCAVCMTSGCHWRPNRRRPGCSKAAISAPAVDAGDAESGRAPRPPRRGATSTPAAWPAGRRRARRRARPWRWCARTRRPRCASPCRRAPRPSPGSRSRCRGRAPRRRTARCRCSARRPRRRWPGRRRGSPPRAFWPASRPPAWRAARSRCRRGPRGRGGRSAGRTAPRSRRRGRGRAASDRRPADSSVEDTRTPSAHRRTHSRQ